MKGQINIPLWTLMGHKGWRKNGKTFMRCYAITLNFCNEFNGNFVLLYFSRIIKIWHVYLKHVEKSNKAVHLRLVFTYLHSNLSNIKKHLVLVLKKIVHIHFFVFQSNLNQAVNVFCKLGEWISIYKWCSVLAL